MRLILVRHGEVDYSNKENTAPGSDPKLTPRGRLQAKKLAKRLSNEKFDVIYSSKKARTLETLSYIRKHHPKIKVIINPDLKEIKTEVLGSKKRKEVTHKRIKEDRKRIDCAIEKILKNHKIGKNILLVVHGNVINYLISKFMKLNRKMFWKLMIWPSSVTIIETDKKGFIIHRLGDTSHLKEHELKMQPHLDFDGKHKN